MLPNVARTQIKPKMGGYIYPEITKVWYYLRQILQVDYSMSVFFKKKFNGLSYKKVIYSFHMLGARCLCTISKGN